MEVRCPQCRGVVEVDDPDTVTELSCGSCGCEMQLSQSHLANTRTIPADGLEMTERSEGLEIDLQSLSDDPVFIAQFQLLEPLGRGGYGTVWKARDTTLNRIVAVKIPRKSELTDEEAESFFSEARAAAQLQHPNIVSIHEVGRDDERVYIVSDLIDGQPLSKWRRDHKTSPREAAEICRKIADALQHAHASGVIHRDVKLSNVMIDDDGEPHVMDFGLAKCDSSELTPSTGGGAMGTPTYMSPEQALGDESHLDHRTDLYSLGVVLFQLLTGDPPFRGSTPIIIQQVIHDDPPHVRSLNRSVPLDLDTICWKLMEKQPQQRYDTAADLSREFERFLRGEPILARPISPVARAWRWCCRHQAIALLTALVALVLLVGSVVSTTQWIRAEKNAQQAVKSANDARSSAEREREARAATEQYLYISRMNSTQQAFELGDLQRVNTILAIYAGPFRQGMDPRGFEWHYWSRQSRRWWAQYHRHEAPVLSVDISKDGRLIASASHRGVICIWDTTTQSLRHEIRANDRSVYAVAFSPDGQTLASGGRDDIIQIWDVETGMRIAELPGHDGTVFGLGYSRDGKRLVSAGSDTLVKLWDLESGETLQAFDGHIDFVYAAEISPDGNRVASCGLDRTLRIWDVESGEPVHKLEKHAIEAWAVAFSPDGKQLASASGDKTIRLWDVETGQELEILEGHSDRVRGIEYSPDGTLLVSVGHDRTVRIWDLVNKSGPQEVPYRNLGRRPDHFFERLTLPKGHRKSSLVGHVAPITSVAFCDDGETIVTGSEDLRVTEWKLSTFDDGSTITGHEKTINSVTFTPDGNTLVSASNDRTVRFWDPRTGESVGPPLKHEGRLVTVAVSPDARWLASGALGGEVVVWKLADRAPTSLQAHERGTSCVLFSPDGKLLVTTGHDGLVKLWDFPSLKEVHRFEEHEGRVYNAVFLEEGRWLATASADNTVRIWDVANRKLIRTMQGHDDRVWALAASSQGLIASGGEDRSIRIWNPRTGQTIHTLRGHGDLVQSLVFSPDGGTLVSGSGDKTIKLWDVPTGEPKTILRGHDYRVWSLAFNPKGTVLASCSYVVKVWRGE